MTASIQRPWGADGTDAANNRPQGAGWDYLSNQMGLNVANTVPDIRGWKLRQPGGGEEILTVQGGLALALSVAAVTNLSGVLAAAAGQVLKVGVQLNYGTNLGLANAANIAIRAQSNDANIANVSLVYSAALSVPSEGNLVFVSAATNLTAATVGVTKLFVNSSSIVSGGGQVIPRRDGHGTINVATTVGGTVNTAIAV